LLKTCIYGISEALSWISVLVLASQRLIDEKFPMLKQRKAKLPARARQVLDSGEIEVTGELRNDTVVRLDSAFQ
jgi:hypothetical protein